MSVTVLLCCCCYITCRNAVVVLAACHTAEISPTVLNSLCFGIDKYGASSALSFFFFFVERSVYKVYKQAVSKQAEYKQAVYKQVVSKQAVSKQAVSKQAVYKKILITC